MSKLYYGSIDLTKIDKSKILDKDKNGNKFKNGAKYVNIAVWVNDDKDKYGNDASIQMSQSKEEREQKKPVVYIGNLKAFEKRGNEPQTNFNESDDLPF